MRDDDYPIVVTMKTKGYVERAIITALPDGPTEEHRNALDTWMIHRHVQNVEESAEASTTRRALNRLEDKGLVEEHTPERFDQPPRRKYWRLTEAGDEENSEIKRAFDEAQNEVRKRYGQRTHD